MSDLMIQQIQYINQPFSKCLFLPEYSKNPPYLFLLAVGEGIYKSFCFQQHKCIFQGFI